MPSPTIKGTFVTLRWGTSGTMKTPLNAAIVKSIKSSRLGGEPIKIEDNDGYTAIVVGLNDGDRLEIALVDDTSLTWPARFDVVSLQKPGEDAPKNFMVVDCGESLERKKEGERTLTCEFYAAFNMDLTYPAA